MHMPLFRRLARVSAILVTATAMVSPGIAQDFPKKQPIKIVVPYNPGAGTDALARVTADLLQRRLGQTVIVDNRPGAAGAIGADYVAKAAPDGYTLLFFPGGDLTVGPAVRNNLPFKFDEFSFLVRGFTSQPMLLATPNFPASTIPELVSYMKAHPGKVSFASPGVGHIVHLGMAMFESAVGVKALIVPYTGAAPIFKDLLGGTVDLTAATPPFPDGAKVLGSVGSRRSPFFPALGTLEEAGIKNASYDIWFGFVAPPKLPPAVAERLITEIKAVLKDPEAIARYQEVARISPDATPLTGETFKKAVLQEQKNWKAIVTREKIEVQ